LLLVVLQYGQHRSEPMQKSKRITTAKLRGAETPGVNQHRSVSDKVAITNGRRHQWNYAQCDSMTTCTETKHFASST
jgi:hypothetical protein